MLRDMLSLLQEKGDFFLKLLIEHMQISLIAIIIATVIGLILGVIISEYKKSSKTILGIINFNDSLYFTIRFFNSFFWNW